MTNYKLVPVELIDRFPEINPSNYDHDDACTLNAWGVELVLAAVNAPTVQEEPVGWQFYQHGEWWHGDDTIKGHRKNTEEAGFRVRDVYAEPQPALSSFLEKEEWNDAFAQGFNEGFNSDEKPSPDVAGLVEALKSARVDLRDWMVSFEQDADLRATKSVLAKIDAALTGYRKQEGEV